MNMQSIQSLSVSLTAGTEAKPTRPTATTSETDGTTAARAPGAGRPPHGTLPKEVLETQASIFFQEESTTLSQANQALAGEGTSRLTRDLESMIAELVSSGYLSDEATEEVNSAFSSFSIEIEIQITSYTEGSSSVQQLATDLQTAFESLRDTLDPLLTALSELTSGSSSEEDSSLKALSTFTSELASLFDTALTTLIEELEATGTSAADSSGQGMAFASFMDILSNMSGTGSTEEGIQMSLSA